MSKTPFGDLGGLLKQAQKMKENMAAVQEQLADKVVEASAGGGMVTVRINGRQEVTAVEIDPAVIDPEEREMLEDLVVAAVNEAVRRSQELMKDELSKATGVLNIPGLFP